MILSPKARLPRLSLTQLVAMLVVTACTPSPAPDPKAAASEAPAAAAAPVVAAPSAAPAPAAEPAQSAAIGKPAPDFTLKDLEGHDVKLSSFRGKPVVLEWFNPGCPFVNAAHTKGSLRGAADRHLAKGVVWLAVNSNAPGREGSGLEKNAQGKKRFALAHPILLDESGAVGRAYGATNTPHMFVIDATGALVYRGALDNSPDGEGQSPTGPKLVRHVDAALEDLAAGRPVAIPETKAYGCSVKYAQK